MRIAAACVRCGVVLLCCCFLCFAADIHFFVIPIDATSGTANEEGQVQITQDNQIIVLKNARLFQVKAINTDGQLSVNFGGLSATGPCTQNQCLLSTRFPPGSLL